ncbi:bifunctional 4-hydroxy-2-oxoglutarate aldolase/2-dehydro-3-deoxy-phosphogluconate aldolase [Streptomyces sp. NBC_00250]|uniref:bifunctional 4-hydroxy-2-oxoglutarate aldolase/2-dehydro-3-deoxy-phosphogluconate aldolase n=1 Tax=Streptomyces sp. NBC_00250 TaxID=2903641 RepID=UPI002E2E41C0|nr:bifunctional 4-hydroxy-2-oxoglutarate aldolase/2-dehydro-3-deoxy-phosphogluconate aldolase [Streptomyces sp. NBC_00250]
MTTPESFPAELTADPVIAVIRAPHIADAPALCAALAQGGIRHVEFTFTTPDVTRHLAQAAATSAHVGVGTVLTRRQAELAVQAGARFLVTPGCRPEVAEVAHEAGIPAVLGALTPTEVAQAVDLGAAAVKIFPASGFGPRYLKDLHGPYPGIPLIASGGVNAANAGEYLAHGALAVCAGSEVVPPVAVAEGNWDEITRRTAAFMSSLAR